MNRPRAAWYALVFASVPAMFFACGGRSDLGLEEEEGPQVAGRGGAAGTSGTSGTSGKAGTNQGGKAGTTAGGTSGSGGITGGGGTMGGGGTSQGGKAGTTSMGGTSGTGGKGGGGKGGGGKGTGAGGKDLFDSGIPIPDSGPIGECAQCIAGKCDDAINTCYNNPNCLSGLQCSVQMCLAGGGAGGMGSGTGGSGGNGGGLDFQCILGCFNGDIGAALTVVQAFQCVTGTCGDVCSNLIPGGGGDGGQAFGGGPMGGPGGGPMGGPGGGQGQGGMPGGGMGGPGGPGTMGGGGMMAVNPDPVPSQTDPFGGGNGQIYLQPGEMWLGETRVPFPEEVPGYPDLADALRRP